MHAKVSQKKGDHIITNTNIPAEVQTSKRNSVQKNSKETDKNEILSLFNENISAAKFVRIKSEKSKIALKIRFEGEKGNGIDGNVQRNRNLLHFYQDLKRSVRTTTSKVFEK